MKRRRDRRRPLSPAVAAILFLTVALAARFLTLALPSRGAPAPHLSPRALGDALTVIKLGGADGDAAALALRTDDLSLAAFASNNGGRRHWHAFPGNEHLLANHSHALLPFGNTYHDLIGGLANLPGVPLGRASVLHAVRVLSAYDPPTAADDDDNHEELKRALAALTVMFSEALRLTPIQETVSKGWETEARVAVEHLPYIEHWDTMCFEIIRSHRSGGGAWKGPFTELLKNSANIRSKEEALAVVKVLVDRSFGDLMMAHATMIDI